jgi:nucleotide-binding universal stress UspA family protein
MPRAVLVPLDGSPFSERAIPVAVSIARRNRMRVELVLVHEPFIILPPGPRATPSVSPVMDGEWRSRHGAYIRDLVARVKGATNVPINGVVMDGAVAAGIAEHADTTDARLIVLSTHGAGIASRLWLGSVPRAITHVAPVPVLLVKPDSSSVEPPRDRFRNVLIPLDGSLLGETAVQYSTLVAGKAGAEYTLLRVVTPLEEWQLGAGSWASDDDLAVTEAEAYLDTQAADLRAQGFRVRTEVVRGRRSADSILDYAMKHGVDLIALTTHSRSAASRFFRRSVADRIAREGVIAALVARQYEPVTTEPAVRRSRRRQTMLV